jgi:hypothetical protein
MEEAKSKENNMKETVDERKSEALDTEEDETAMRISKDDDDPVKVRVEALEAQCQQQNQLMEYWREENRNLVIQMGGLRTEVGGLYTVNDGLRTQVGALQAQVGLTDSSSARDRCN